MNIFAEIAKERFEEKKQYVTALIINGKSLNEADEETERFMVENTANIGDVECRRIMSR